ncbi:hypothetical protein KAR91_30365 [Candidatus Pacearchaeota archaeon]|nr:hypothetical protein [Candidatus Pacearchaeota archaeon]
MTNISPYTIDTAERDFLEEIEESKKRIEESKKGNIFAMELFREILKTKEYGIILNNPECSNMCTVYLGKYLKTLGASVSSTIKYNYKSNSLYLCIADFRFHIEIDDNFVDKITELENVFEGSFAESKNDGGGK